MSNRIEILQLNSNLNYDKINEALSKALFHKRIDANKILNMIKAVTRTLIEFLFFTDIRISRDLNEF